MRKIKVWMAAGTASFVSQVDAFAASEAGATAIEYGLLASLIAVVVIVAVQSVGTNLSSKFQSVANNLS